MKILGMGVPELLIILPVYSSPRLRAVARCIFWHGILTQRQNCDILSILTQRQNQFMLTMEEETHVRKLHLL